LEPDGAPLRRSREMEALDFLQRPAGEPGLTGYWHLLKADLLRRVGDLAEAGKEVDAATKATPPPPERQIPQVRIPLLIGQQQFAAAIQVVKGSHEEQPAKELWMVRIHLSEIARPPEGADRYGIESELFRSVQTLRLSKSPESRLALLELAQSGISPDDRQPAIA